MCTIEYNYDFIIGRLDIQTPETRKELIDIIFLHKNLYDRINCPAIFEVIKACPRHLRKIFICSIKFFQGYLCNTYLVWKMCIVGKSLIRILIFLSVSFTSFKNSVLARSCVIFTYKKKHMYYLFYVLTDTYIILL